MISTITPALSQFKICLMCYKPSPALENTSICAWLIPKEHQIVNRANLTQYDQLHPLFVTAFLLPPEGRRLQLPQSLYVPESKQSDATTIQIHEPILLEQELAWDQRQDSNGVWFTTMTQRGYDLGFRFDSNIWGLIQGIASKEHDEEIDEMFDRITTQEHRSSIENTLEQWQKILQAHHSRTG